jgi:hypothetical protein
MKTILVKGDWSPFSSADLTAACADFSQRAETHGLNFQLIKNAPESMEDYFDYVITVKRTTEASPALDAYAPPIVAFLTDRKRATMEEVLGQALRLPRSQWTPAEQRRVGKILKGMSWGRQRVQGEQPEWHYAAPGYFDPSEGDGRFLQCAACTGYFGRMPYQSKTTCPCGECEPIGLYPPLQSERSSEPDPASQAFQSAPSQAPSKPTSGHSHSAAPTSRRGERETAQRTRQSPHRPAHSETDHSQVSPIVESDSISESACNSTGQL